MTAMEICRKRTPGIVIWLIMALVSSFFAWPPAASAAAQGERVLESRPVSDGLILEKRDVAVSGGRAVAYILRADLTNQYLKVNTLVGSGGTLNKNGRVADMAAGAGAVAAVNADFFQMGESGRPIGMTYKDGKLVTSPPLRDDMYGWAVTSGGVPMIEVFSFSGKVTAKNGAQFPLAGINKPSYIQAGEKNSHDGTLLMYDRFWGQASRGKTGAGDSVVEVFVSNGAVTEILDSQPGKAIPLNGYVLAGRGPAAQYIKTNIKVGDRISVDYKVGPEGDKIWAGTGGWSLLVDKGQAMGGFPSDISGPNARTAVGYTSSKKTLVVVTVEKSGTSRGMTLNELAAYMVSLGVDRALNLDGGGSTTLAARPLGEGSPVLVNNPQREVQRLLPTALGFFSSAPRTGLAGLIIKGPDNVFPGDTVTYFLKGYDSHYNPYPVAPAIASWSLAPGQGSLSAGVFTAGKSGDAVIRASVGSLEVTRTVRVFGAADLKKISVEPASITVKPGSTVKIKVSAVDNAGVVYNLTPQNYLFSLDASAGKISDEVFTAAATPASGQLKISLDTLTVTVPVEVREEKPEKPAVSFKDMAGYTWAAGPVSRLASAGVVSGYPDGSFGPGRQVTRAEFVVMLGKAMGWQPEKGESGFRDGSSLPAWAGGHILAAVNKGVVSGYSDKTFLPSGLVTRQEMAVMISRALSLPADEGSQPARVFSDGKSVASWAAGSVSGIYAAGIIKGDSEKRFRPGDRATRAESAAVLDGAMTYLKGKK